MHPEYFDQKLDGTIEFLYDVTEFAEWKKLGETEGTVGPILKFISGIYMTYWSFGTLEHSNTSMSVIKLVHNSHFDGPLRPAHGYLKGPAQKREKEYWDDKIKSMRIVFVDLSA